MRNYTLRPQITVSQSEYQKLLALAAAGSGPLSAGAARLFDEMERARIVADQKLPADIVRMGSRVVYRTDRDEELAVVLVFPADADISERKLSVLTPVGAALIGLRTGQSITWESRDGRNNALTVLSVVQDAAQPVETR